MVPNRVVFCKLAGQFFLTFLPEYMELVFPDPIRHPMKYNVNISEPFLLDVLFTMIFYAEFSDTTGVGGCIWSISCSAVRIEVEFYSSRIIYPVQLLWRIPRHCALY